MIKSGDHCPVFLISFTYFTGYPPQQQPGYPPQQPGYPPQQPGYPPQQSGYPPQQLGYPSQQPGYPPSGKCILDRISTCISIFESFTQ